MSSDSSDDPVAALRARPRRGSTAVERHGRDPMPPPLRAAPQPPADDEPPGPGALPTRSDARAAAAADTDTASAPGSAQLRPTAAEDLDPLDSQQVVTAEPNAGRGPLDPPQARSAPPSSRSSTPRRNRPAAWAKVAAAGFSAKRESRSWTPYTPRLPESTWAALEARKLTDARRTGDYGIAVAHYLQVAFDGLPRIEERIDAAETARTGLEWLQSVGHPGALVPTGSRIMKSMKAQMQDLALMLKAQQPKVELWVVQAAYVQALLDALDREAPPGSPAS